MNVRRTRTINSRNVSRLVDRLSSHRRKRSRRQKDRRASSPSMGGSVASSTGGSGGRSRNSKDNIKRLSGQQPIFGRFCGENNQVNTCTSLRLSILLYW